MVSSKQDKRFEKSVLSFSSNSSADFTSDTSFVSSTANFTINISKTPRQKQKIVGFGGALTDATAIVVNQLPATVQDFFFQSYFSKEGIEYNLVRTNIAGCDFSAREYTYADQPGDFDLATFALAAEDTELKIPMLKRIQSEFAARDSLRYYASAWTAPNWMKTNNASTGHGRLLGEPGDAYHKTWANYHVKFLEEYAALGVTFWAITMQNEPINGLVNNAKWQQTAWTPYTQRDWLSKDLGPAIADSKFPETEIIILDDQRFDLPFWPKIVMSENTEWNNVNGIGLHWYADEFWSANVLDLTHRALPEMWMLGTEACNKLKGADVVSTNSLGSWEHGENYSTDILIDLNHWVGGWTDWNMALNLDGKPNWAGNSDDAPIIIDADNAMFYKNPMFYHLGHFSKFSDEGWTVIGGSDSDDSFLYIVMQSNANQLPNLRSIVVLNKYDEDLVVVINDKSVGDLDVVVEQRSIQSFIYYF